jgi:hypothetical protein
MMKKMKKVIIIIHTSVGSDGGICCNGKACQENQRHHTCSKRFDDPPFLWCDAGINTESQSCLCDDDRREKGKTKGEFGSCERERERDAERLRIRKKKKKKKKM